MNNLSKVISLPRKPFNLAINDPIAGFAEALQKGLGISVTPVPDGQVHRVHDPKGKRQNLDGWYVLYLDSVPAGAYGNWRTGEQGSWCAGKLDDLSPLERERQRQIIEEARIEREREKLTAQAGCCP